MHLSQSIPIVLFSALVHAKTDLAGCTRTDVSSPASASYAWIVPDTGELCDFLDCGGGRAPPKTTVPGCPLYVGTETYKPSFLAGFGAAVTGDVTGTIAGPTITTSAATVTATAAVDDDTDTDDEGNTDDIDDFYDLMITYPADWNNWTPEQQANWWSSYGYNSAAAITATTSFTSGTSTSSQRSTAASSDSSVSSSTSNSAVSITNAAATSTTSTKDLPTLAAASTTSAVTNASLSMTRSWVKTIPTFARGAADVENDRASRASVSASGSTSASASLVDSTGAAGKVDCVFGGVGIVAAVIGVLAVF
ncbi:hypothetical protein KCU95_g2521, partial [Aureobasidium melanogenum]